MEALKAFGDDWAAVGVGGDEAGVDAVGNKLVDAFAGADGAGLCFKDLARAPAAPDTEATGGDVTDNADGAAVAVEKFRVYREAHADGVDGIALWNEKARARGKAGAAEETLRALGEGVGDFDIYAVKRGHLRLMIDSTGDNKRTTARWRRNIYYLLSVIYYLLSVICKAKARRFRGGPLLC